jgi:GAF domain-containing protein
MTPAPIPAGESARYEALLRTRLLDPIPDESLQSLARCVARMTGAPIALVSLVDKDRQWFLCKVGLQAEETPRDISFCGHAIMDREPLIVPNVFNDVRFFNNPLVVSPPNLRAYLGAPIITRAGHPLGTLCALDTEPRDWTANDMDLVCELAQVASSLIEARTVRPELRDLFAPA